MNEILNDGIETVIAVLENTSNKLVAQGLTQQESVALVGERLKELLEVYEKTMEEMWPNQ